MFPVNLHPSFPLYLCLANTIKILRWRWFLQKLGKRNDLEVSKEIRRTDVQAISSHYYKRNKRTEDRSWMLHSICLFHKDTGHYWTETNPQWFLLFKIPSTECMRAKNNATEFLFTVVHWLSTCVSRRDIKGENSASHYSHLYVVVCVLTVVNGDQVNIIYSYWAYLK